MLARKSRAKAPRRVIPGFGLTFGLTVTYLSLLVLIPLAGIFLKTAGIGWGVFWAATTSRQVVAAYRVSFGISFAAAATNALFGSLVAWAIVRYRFPGRRLFDGMVDLPFALPTAVAGIALTAIYARTGWLGQFFYPLGLETAYSRLGIFIALTFVGLPFVVRTLQPVIADLDIEIEEAAASLGAPRWQTLRLVIFPALLPAILTGFALSFARALGEYGSVIFISGNMPLKTEISPLVIVKFLEQYQVKEATAVAVVMLVFSFIMLLGINILQRWSESVGSARR